MDTYHGSHGDSSDFESEAGLSIPRVLLSSPDGVTDEDTFLCPSFLVAGFVLIAFTSDSSNSLRRIRRLAFLYLCTLISLSILSRSKSSARISIMGVDGFSCSFSDFFRLNALTWEHCSTFGLKANFSVCPLILSWISSAPTLVCAFAVLKNSLPRMRGVLASTSMSRTTKSTGINRFRILTGTFSAIPVG